MTQRVTVVLSGGGAKAAAHLAPRGRWRSGARPVRYVATSMGAVIAAALAAGPTGRAPARSSERGARRGSSATRSRRWPGLFARSLLRPAPFRRAIEALVPVRRFADLAGAAHGTASTSTAGAAALRRRRRGRPAGRRAVRHLRAAALLPARAARRPLAAATAGSGRPAARGGGPARPGAGRGGGRRAGVRPGSGPARAGAPPLVRAHDEAVGTLMAAHDRGAAGALARGAGTPAAGRTSGRWWSATRPSESTGSASYAEDGYRAAREALALDPRA